MPSESVLLDFLVSRDTEEVREFDAQCRSRIDWQNENTSEELPEPGVETIESPETNIHKFEILEAY